MAALAKGWSPLMATLGILGTLRAHYRTHLALTTSSVKIVLKASYKGASASVSAETLSKSKLKPTGSWMVRLDFVMVTREWQAGRDRVCVREREGEGDRASARG
jgi:hypothetical protein